MTVLHSGAGGQLYSGADAVAVAGRALELKFQPVRLAGGIVQPYLGGSAQRRGHDIEAAGTIQVRHSGAAMPGWRLCGQPVLGGQRLKSVAPQIMKYRVRLLDLRLRLGPERLHVSTRHKDVLP